MLVSRCFEQQHDPETNEKAGFYIIEAGKGTSRVETTQGKIAELYSSR